MGLIFNRSNNNGCSKHHYEHYDIDNPDFRIWCKLDEIELTKQKKYRCQHHGCNKTRSERGLSAGFDHVANVEREKFHEIFDALADNNKDVVVVDQKEKETRKIAAKIVFEGETQNITCLKPGEKTDISEYVGHNAYIKVISE